jgi:glycerol-3-phosphate O-acyltransferase
MLTPHFFGEQTHMSLGQKISRAILQWPVSGLVNHKSLPENPIKEL